MVSGEEVSAAVEEYLECIYRLQEKGGIARTGDIAKSLGVVPGTVINMVKWLEGRGLVKRVPYKGIALTEEGRRIAIRVIRRHRLSERLLTDILGIEWHKAHDLACKLEHAIADEMLEPLERALKHPKACPHGNPIPTERGDFSEEGSEPLAGLEAGEGGVVVKIIEEGPEVLRYLAAVGLMPGASVEVVEKSPFDGSMIVKVGGANHALGPKMASIIHVKRGCDGWRRS